jgi:hypothetical protein
MPPKKTTTKAAGDKKAKLYPQKVTTNPQVALANQKPAKYIPDLKPAKNISAQHDLKDAPPSKSGPPQNPFLKDAPPSKSGPPQNLFLKDAPPSKSGPPQNPFLNDAPPSKSGPPQNPFFQRDDSKNDQHNPEQPLPANNMLLKPPKKNPHPTADKGIFAQHIPEKIRKVDSPGH